ncbi:MAG: hypothetical protein GF331_25770 [Chitinivibrionales bacterium]|nr:hypothetical protein [Chitinivibrionales bacterium]
MPERRWVFDTVAVSNFLLTDSVAVLRSRYAGKALLTWQVYDELGAGVARRPPLKAIDRHIDEGLFTLATLTREEHDLWLALIPSLGRGEASCIAVAVRRTAVVVSDDKTARRRCADHGVSCTGTVGILRAAVRDNQLIMDTADGILARMIEAGFRAPVQRISDLTAGE